MAVIHHAALSIDMEINGDLQALAAFTSDTH
jgi:hypothetical protein